MRIPNQYEWALLAGLAHAAPLELDAQQAYAAATSCQEKGWVAPLTGNGLAYCLTHLGRAILRRHSPAWPQVATQPF